MAEKIVLFIIVAFYILFGIFTVMFLIEAYVVIKPQINPIKIIVSPFLTALEIFGIFILYSHVMHS